MNRDNDRQTSIILAVLGILPIVWLGLLIAPSVKGGLPEILPSLMNVMSDPFHIVLCEDSVKTVLVLLAKLLNISDTQLSYITNVDAGHGLIKVGSSLVPFANKFPKNTKLYKLMTTKPGEGA